MWYIYIYDIYIICTWILSAWGSQVPEDLHQCFGPRNSAKLIPIPRWFAPGPIFSDFQVPCLFTSGQKTHMVNFPLIESLIWWMSHFFMVNFPCQETRRWCIRNVSSFSSDLERQHTQIRCRPCIATVTTVMPSLDDMAEHTAHAHGDCTAVSSTHLNMFVIGDHYAEHGWTCCGSRKCLNQPTKFCNKILNKYSDNSCERTVLASVLAICQSSAHKHIMLDQETADNQWSPNDQWVNTWLPKNCDWRPSKSVAYSVAFPRFCSANVGDKEKKSSSNDCQAWCWEILHAL